MVLCIDMRFDLSRVAIFPEGGFAMLKQKLTLLAAFAVAAAPLGKAV
jgi:hypothetical protein